MHNVGLGDYMFWYATDKNKGYDDAMFDEFGKGLKGISKVGLRMYPVLTGIRIRTWPTKSLNV